MLKSFTTRLADWLDPMRAHFAAVAETEETITKGRSNWDDSFRNRFDYDRARLLEKIINSRRSNPITKRVIEVTTEFVIGDGFSFACKDGKIATFLQEFWAHELNDIDAQLPEWTDETSSTGDLFILFSVDQGNMPYVRAIPAETITEIVTENNDYRQEKYFMRGAHDEEPYLSYAEWQHAEEEAKKRGFVLHFPLNRMVGAYFGESDLTPILYWINVYQDFLENRARVNFFRQLYTFIVQKAFKSDSEKKTWVNDFVSKLPKKSGGVLAMDPSESLSIVTPELGSFEAETDGLMLKRMIALGVGLPLHYLAEPESSTRTTAEAAGTPTFKRFKRRQNFMRSVVLKVLQTATELRFGNKPDDITITVPDVTERDNANLAMAVQRITQAFIPLYNAQKITAKELIRLVYRFLAETAPETIPDEDSPIETKQPSAGIPANQPGSADSTDQLDPLAQDNNNG